MAFFVAALAVCASAQVVPPSRTLPEYIKRIYVPTFKNNSRLFGAQADLTLYVNDEFMADGRLDVVQNERADVRVEGYIKDWRDYTNSAGSDKFPLVSTMQMRCIVELWDPYDTDRITPVAHYVVTAIVQYVSDPRRSISETDTDARDRLLRTMAKNIVQQIMTGAPTPDLAKRRKTVERYQERHAIQQYEPVITQPRFPKATPVPNSGL